MQMMMTSDETQIRSKQLSTVAIVGFQFGLYHVVVVVVLRSISLASLFAIFSKGTLNFFENYNI